MQVLEHAPSTITRKAADKANRRKDAQDNPAQEPRPEMSILAGLSASSSACSGYRSWPCRTRSLGHLVSLTHMDTAPWETHQQQKEDPEKPTCLLGAMPS